MKKIILLLGILFVTSTVAQAACDYSCVEPYDLNNKFRTFWGAVSGVNSVVENAAESIIASIFPSERVFQLSILEISFILSAW